LTHVVSAAMPPDGLLTLGLAGRIGQTLYRVGEDLLETNGQDLRLWAGYGLLPWLHVGAEGRLRSFEAEELLGQPGGWALGDTRLTAVGGAPVLGRWLALAVFGGVDLPTGDPERGYTEDAVSPHAGAAATLRLFIDGQLPELRLHVNYGYRWNRNESAGYGAAPESGLDPWFPRYQSAAAAGGSDANNDYTLLGGALEFRKQTVALWLEYYQYRLDADEFVAAKEDPRFVTAGLRWGVSEGWALHAAYEVSLAEDDTATPFWPAYPDLSYHLGVSFQLPLGGRDRDDDGIPDRRDRCPREREDFDGFRDADGCPDLDNDEDGVPDARDLMPLAPEDRDGWQDADGAPDLDNDGDGIPDDEDFCPDVAEDFDGRDDTDGCPEEVADRDGDGVADPDDVCPEQMEDRDGFQDEDGCPDLDNDLDGIPDEQDACPDEAEDYDGDADADGCPDSPPPARGGAADGG
jgi:hypothetical protein